MMRLLVKISRLAVFICVWAGVSLVFPAGGAQNKNWIGSGDGLSWSEGSNWSPQGVPAASEAVTVDLQGAAVTCDKTFSAKSLTVGGASGSSLTVDSFIYGAIAPDSSEEPALYIRKDGAVTLKGPGTVTLKGQFKNSQESVAGEESFMFVLE